MEKNEKIARDNLLRGSEEIKGTKIKGYNFDKGVNWEEIVKSFKNFGFQASQFSKAIEITNKMINEKAFIFLGYTSNMVSSGNREIIRYLTEKKNDCWGGRRRYHKMPQRFCSRGFQSKWQGIKGKRNKQDRKYLCL